MPACVTPPKPTMELSSTILTVGLPCMSEDWLGVDDRGIAFGEVHRMTALICQTQLLKASRRVLLIVFFVLTK